MKKVFVSYSRNNLDVITQLVKDLQAVGMETWHDQTLTGGQRWWDNILANIRGCDIFVFALSPESWESEACRSELGYVVPKSPSPSTTASAGNRPSASAASCCSPTARRPYIGPQLGRAARPVWTS